MAMQWFLWERREGGESTPSGVLVTRCPVGAFINLTIKSVDPQSTWEVEGEEGESVQNNSPRGKNYKERELHQRTVERSFFKIIIRAYS